MNRLRFISNLSCLIVLIFSSGSVLAQDGNAPPLSVCILLSHPRVSEGKPVFVEGRLTATMEAMWLANANCPKKLFLRYDPGDGDAAWKAWQDAVNDQIGGIDRRPMHVVVQGVFRGRLRSGNHYIAQLKITKIIAWDRKSSTTSEASPQSQQ